MCPVAQADGHDVPGLVHRTTPWTAGIGPLSMIVTRAARCASFSFEGCPGALRSIRPSGPEPLNFITQPRAICGVPPADPGRLRARRTVVDRRQGQEPPGL